MKTSKHSIAEDIEVPHKTKKRIDVSTMIPASQRQVSDELLTDFEVMKERMTAVVEQFRLAVKEASKKADGKVSPDLLKSVKVRMPTTGKMVPIDDVATVGVRDGIALVVTVFDEAVGLSSPPPPSI
jgi:ribosome recycling factor